MNMLKASIATRQWEVEYLHFRLCRSAMTDKVVNIIDKGYEELMALHNVPISAATPVAPSSSTLSNEEGVLSQDIFVYATRVVDIAGGKAIAELKNALNKMKLKDAPKDLQQGPAITKDTVADTVRKAVQDALRNDKGIFPLTSLKRKATDSSRVEFSNEEKRHKASQNGQQKSNSTPAKQNPTEGGRKRKSSDAATSATKVKTYKSQKKTQKVHVLGLTARLTLIGY